MVVGMITIGTCYGDTDIPVELLGKGPRPGTAWVKALAGMQPFTKISHGGPYQDNTIVVPLLVVRDVHLELVQCKELVEDIPEEAKIPAPVRYTLAEDWFLEAAYEDRTTRE